MRNQNKNTMIDKKLNLKVLMKRSLLGLAATSLLFTACNSDDDEEMMDTNMPAGMLTVTDQSISQNTVVVSNVNVDQDSWLVVHASENDAPVVPGIISEPVLVESGNNSDVELPIIDFASLSDGATVWVMLHTDNGLAGEYEFDGASGIDNPITTEAGAIVMTNIEVSAPSVAVNNQIVDENMVTIEEVDAAVDGWIVIHEDDGEGNPGPVLGQTFVEAGINENVMIDLGAATFAGGEMLFPMLHIESPADGEYGFPDNGDGPEVFGENVVVVGFETEAPAGEFTANNQTVSQSQVIVESITVSQSSWVVVHRDNGEGSFVAPGIISEPVFLEAGTTENVAISFTEELVDGETLWIMLHNDNGTIGSYEFDGSGNGVDSPIIFDSIEITAPSVTVQDQAVSNNMVNISEVSAAVEGWIVIHDGSASGPVIGQTFVEAGINTNVMVDVSAGNVTTGDELFPMLHIEDPADGVYGFPENGDGPEVFNEGNVIVVSFSVL